MKIGLNMLFVTTGIAGGRVYCEHLLRGLAALDQRNHYVIYTRSDANLSLPNWDRFTQFRAPVSGESTIRRARWEYQRLPRRMELDAVQLFHGLASISPAARHCPFVLTIHDLIYRCHPQSMPLGHRLFMRLMHGRIARLADRVIVPSQFSAQEVTRHLGVSAERIRVIPYGPGSGHKPVTDSERIQSTLKNYGLHRPFILNVCRGYSHKNLIGLLQAFARLRMKGLDQVDLVIVGDRYQSEQQADYWVRKLALGNSVRFTGFVPNEDLGVLYSAADVFAFPSLAEGLGLPILEAMSCGTPVVASDATAIPEVVGDAGLLADASDPEAFSDALVRVLNAPTLQARLSEMGLARAREYSWARCAESTMEVYRELVPDGRT